MVPPLTFAQALTQLATLTSQTANFTFTADELTQALQLAWNDTYVSTIVWDSSLSYSATTWSYTIPTNINNVRELYYARTTTDFPERLSPELYEITNGQIRLLPAASRWLLPGITIYIKGVHKLALTDSLPTTNLVNYTLYLAAESLMDALIFKSAFVFLRNDITVSDISRALQVVQGKVLRYKQTLLREFESS